MTHEQDGAGHHQVHSFACDAPGCTETIECDQGCDFREAWDHARARGWRAFSQGGGFRHRCPQHVGA